jgi:hypothetical protein
MTVPRTNTSGLFTFPPDIHWADSIFDNMMVSRAAVYKKEAVLDAYGNISSSTFVQVDAQNIDLDVPAYGDAVPVLVRNLKGEELNTPPAPASQTSHGIQEFLIFMRVIQVDDPPEPLNIKHWLQIRKLGEDLVDPNDPNAGAVLYNITSISNPALMNHHLEVAATVITP